MEYCLSSKSQIEALDDSAITEKLNYVSEALKLTKNQLAIQKLYLGSAVPLDFSLLHD